MNALNKDNYPKEEQGNQPLPKHIHDDSNGLDYTLVDGTYYLPDLLPPEDEDYTPGTHGLWARRRLHYLKEHRRLLLAELRASGSLNAHLQEIDHSADEMFERLVAQMSERDGLTNELKRRDQMTWVGLANSIRYRASEIVSGELIYC
jgi:hypothetical protein